MIEHDSIRLKLKVNHLVTGTVEAQTANAEVKIEVQKEVDVWL